MEQSSLATRSELPDPNSQLPMYIQKRRIALDEQYITKDDIVEVVFRRGKKSRHVLMGDSESQFFRVVCVAGKWNDGRNILLGQLLIHPTEESQHLHQTPVFIPFPLQDVQCKLEELNWNSIKDYKCSVLGNYDADYHIKEFLNTPRPTPKPKKRKTAEEQTQQIFNQDTNENLGGESQRNGTSKHTKTNSINQEQHRESENSQFFAEGNNTNKKIARQEIDGNTDSSYSASDYSDLDPSVFDIEELHSADEWLNKVLQSDQEQQEAKVNNTTETQITETNENNTNISSNSSAQITPTSPVSLAENVSSNQEDEEVIDVLDDTSAPEPVMEPPKALDPIALYKKIAANLEQIKHLDWDMFHGEDSNIGETYKVMGLLKVAKSRLKNQVDNIFMDTYRRE